MRRSFTLPTKAFSINAAHYRDRSMKTKECRDWERQVLYLLSSPDIQSKILELRAAFDPDKHAFSIRLCFEYPPEVFFNAQGKLSARSFDLSNTEKLLIDLLFDEKYARNSHVAVQNLAANDKYVTSLLSCKKPGTRYNIHVAIKLVPQPKP